jgi:hypothetical protein
MINLVDKVNYKMEEESYQDRESGDEEGEEEEEAHNDKEGP